MYKSSNYNLRNELGSFIKNYSINNYGEDWNYCINLSNKYNVRNNRWRKNISCLFKNISDLDNKIDGFVLNEYDINYYNIHHHIILKSDLDEEEINKIIKMNWKSKGLSEISKYNNEKDYCYYITKHYNKFKENEFEMVKNLI